VLCNLCFLRATAECFTRLCHHLGICLSVTLMSCIKTVQARITKSSLRAAPRSLVYRDKISCHWVQGFPSNEGVEEGYPLERRHFAVIGSNNVKTVADRYIQRTRDFFKMIVRYINVHLLLLLLYMLLIIKSTGDRIFGFMNIDDLERPWTTQREVFSEFFAIFGCSAHFNTELQLNGWR